MSFFPNFDAGAIWLPNVKLKLTSVLIAFSLGTIGWVLSSLMNDALWFARFGSLVVLVAAFFAYFGQLDEKDVEKWANDSKDQMVFNAELQADLDWFDRLTLKEDGQSWDYALQRMPSSFSDSESSIILTATGLGAASKNAEDSMKVIKRLLEDPVSRDRLANYINRRLRTSELIIGAIGTVIWGFGDLLYKIV